MEGSVVGAQGHVRGPRHAPKRGTARIHGNTVTHACTVSPPKHWKEVVTKTGMLQGCYRAKYRY